MQAPAKHDPPQLIFAALESGIALALSFLLMIVPTVLFMAQYIEPSGGSWRYELTPTNDAVEPVSLLQGLSQKFDDYEFSTEISGDQVSLSALSDPGVTLDTAQIADTIRELGYTVSSARGTVQTGGLSALLNPASFDPNAIMAGLDSRDLTMFVGGNLAITAITMILVAGFFVWFYPVPQRWLPFGTWPQKIGAGIGLGFVCMLSTMLLAFIQNLLGIQVQEQAVFVKVFSPENPYRWALLPAVVLGAPLSEELLFRGVIFARFAVRGWLIAGYAVSSLLFALVHFNWTATIAYFLIGLILAWSWEKWRTVFVPFLAHATYNLLVAVVYLSFGT